MTRLIIFLLIATLTACAKSGSDNALLFPEPESLAWYTARKAGLSPCTCLVEAREGLYKNQPVIEFRVIDPVCNGINIVYRANGSEWVSSANQEAYDNYLDEVSQLETIWTCTR